VTISTRLAGTVTVLQLRGTLGAFEGDSGLRPAIRQAVDRGARAVVINLQDVSAIDSSGIADLASGHMTLTSHGGHLKICNLSQKLRDIFVITRLNTVFETYETEADAIAGFQSPTTS
jgi:anti-sigma B factor antagonist